MIFIDANVIVAHFSAGHEFHGRASLFLDETLRRRVDLAISPQVIGETYVTVTSPRLFKNPASPRQFRNLLERFTNNECVKMVSPGAHAVEHALRAADEQSITSHRFFDLLIYGTMREYGITQIATFNEKDFRGLEEIVAVSIP